MAVTVTICFGGAFPIPATAGLNKFHAAPLSLPKRERIYPLDFRDLEKFSPLAPALQFFACPARWPKISPERVFMPSSVLLRSLTLASLAAASLAAVVFGAGACRAADYPIAGLTPNQRPAGAPSILVFKPGPDWEKNMFFGVSQPLPPGLSWVADQGAWYTPFNRPGMTPPYDLRGWRKSEGVK